MHSGPQEAFLWGHRAPHKHFVAQILLKTQNHQFSKGASPYVYSDLAHIMFAVAGVKCAIEMLKRIRGERYLCTHQMTLPYLTLPYLTLN